MSAVLRRTPALPGPLEWARVNLFSSVPNALLTLLSLYLLWKYVPPFVSWALLDAVWQAPSSKACREAAGAGACWAFIGEKHRFILFGTYPFEEHWRPGVSILLFLALYAVSAMRRFWTPWLVLAWLAGLTLIGMLMWGGVFGLRYVENERWGGLVLTLLLATFGIAFAFPLSIVLALGRRSEMPVVRAVCEEAFPSPEGKRQYMRGWLGVVDGRYVVRPVGGAGSHLVGALAHSNALIVVPEAVTEVPVGGAVEVMVLERRLT